MPNEVLATVEAVRGVRQLVTVCAAAEAGGLRVGQTLSQARALCPRLVAAEAEPTQDTAALAALAQWCTRATPLAAAGPPDTLWLDIGGCDHLLGGEARLAEDLADRMQRWGLLARWAVAGTTGAAYALARHAHAAVVPSGAEAAALAMLPIDALRLEPAVVAGLHRLGLRTIGALARLPRGELAARFGQVVLLRLDQAHGAVTEAIRWPPPPPDWTEQERLAEPILTTQACLTVLDLLARRLCNRLAAQRLGGRQFVAAFGIVDGSARQLAVATSRPVCDPAHLVRLLHETLDGLDPGFGIEAVSLGAPAIEASIVRQQDLMSAGHQEQQKLAQLIDMLANRLRPHGLWRTAPRDSHIPEHAVQTTPTTARRHRLVARPRRATADPAAAPARAD